jgi:hypothetical protein
MAFGPDARTAAPPSLFRADCVSKGTLRAKRRSTLMPNDDRLAALRTRAYQLADAGRYSDWETLAFALAKEGALTDALQRLGDDGLFKIMIGSRLKSAQQTRR